jgi:SEC-C motif-containing protein
MVPKSLDQYSLNEAFFMSEDLCLCHSGQLFKECCGPFLNNQTLPQTAEQLMRSRYCAYCLANTEYLLATWHSGTRPKNIELDPAIRWTRLQIRRVHAGASSDSDGQVEYIAVFKRQGKAHRLHELSRFVSEGKKWFYVDGDLL